jgi:PIN domain nuclease of toxin-antitoxin system
LNLLLDSHALLWWLAESNRLSREARQAIADSESTYVSAATAWEISIKTAQGKLDFRGNLEDQMARNQFRPLQITIRHAVAAGQLPRHHADPFDRMLVAQARAESLTLVTTDVQLRAYGVPVLLT